MLCVLELLLPQKWHIEFVLKQHVPLALVRVDISLVGGSDNIKAQGIIDQLSQVINEVGNVTPGLLREHFMRMSELFNELARPTFLTPKLESSCRILSVQAVLCGGDSFDTPNDKEFGVFVADNVCKRISSLSRLFFGVLCDLHSSPVGSF